MNKRILTALCALFLLSVLCLNVFAVAQPTDDFYVADYAGVLSDELEKRISDYNGALEQQCSGAQFVVLTVNYLDGKYSDEYAAQVFSEWGIGDADNNNGVLLLLAVQENKFWLMSGYGIQYSFDPDVDNILDSTFENRFDSGKYDEAVQGVLEDVLKWFDEYYGAQTSTSAQAAGFGTQAGQSGGGGAEINSPTTQRSDAGELIIYLIVIWLIIRWIRRTFGNGGGGGFLFGLLFGRAASRSRNHSSGYSGGYSSGHSGGSYHGGGGGYHGGYSGGHSSGGFGGGSHHGGGGFGGGGGGGRR